MKAIYQPKGPALEYAPLACNIYRGCTHGCHYCFVPGCLRMTKQDFNAQSLPRDGILEQLEKDAAKLQAAGDTREILLCFTSDPYQAFADPKHDITRQALQILVAHGLRFTVLTKGGYRVNRDFDLLRQGGRLGISLVWDDEMHGSIHEPNAAPLHDRIGSLVDAKPIPNWVSVEPVIDHRNAIRAIKSAAPVADEFRVGKINHNKALEEAVDWQAFTDEAYDLLLQSGKKFVFKQSLHKYLRGRPASSQEAG